MTADQFPPEAGEGTVVPPDNQLPEGVEPPSGALKPSLVVTDDTVQAIGEVIRDNEIRFAFGPSYEDRARAVLSSGLVVTRTEHDQVLAQLTSGREIFAETVQAERARVATVLAREEALRQAVRELAQRAVMFPYLTGQDVAAELRALLDTPDEPNG